MDRPGDLPASFRLDGRVAVVIGTGVLRSRMEAALAQVGVLAVIVGRDRNRESLALEAVTATGDEALFEACDASCRTELRDLVDSVLVSHGRIDAPVKDRDGRPFHFVANPALGLWAATTRFD